MRYNALWVSLDACNEVAATSLSLRVIDIAGATPVGDTFFGLPCLLFCGRISSKCEFLSNPALGSAPSEQERLLGVSILAFHL